MTHQNHAALAAEAGERWGETEAFAESKRRTKSYSDADWTRIKAELEKIESDFAATMAAGRAQRCITTSCRATTSPTAAAPSARPRCTYPSAYRAVDEKGTTTTAIPTSTSSSSQSNR